MNFDTLRWRHAAASLLFALLLAPFGKTFGQSSVSGGNIALAGGSTMTSICVDATPDPLDVTRDGTAVGQNALWVITDDAGKILGLPPRPPFDLNGAGPGTCQIWYLRYNGIVSGVVMGANIANFSGNFSFSNPITVVRNEPKGGTLAFADGTTEATITVDGTPDPLAVALSGDRAGTNRAWVITDLTGTILGLPMAPPFDLDGAGLGTCLIWYLRYEDGLTGLTAGANANALNGCFSFSNPLTVKRVAPVSGMVATGQVSMPSGATTRYVCPGNDGPFTVQTNYATPVGQLAYAITDADGKILAISMSNMIDLSGASVGTCFVWAFNYTGTITGAPGDNVFSTQFSTDQWLISQNAVEAVRQTPEAGTISTVAGETTVYACIDGQADVWGFQPTGNSGANFLLVITDANNMILGLNRQGFQDFDGAGIGDCRVWGLSYTGSLTAKPGDNATTVTFSDGCSDLSDNFVTVVRETPDGATVSGNGKPIVMLSGGTSVVNFATTSMSTARYTYFVLDPSFQIVAITPNVYDFASAPDGQYLVYGASYTGAVLPTVGGPLFGQRISRGCFDLSDGAVSVMVNRGMRFTAAPVSTTDIRLSLAPDSRSPSVR